MEEGGIGGRRQIDFVPEKENGLLLFGKKSGVGENRKIRTSDPEDAVGSREGLSCPSDPFLLDPVFRWTDSSRIKKDKIAEGKGKTSFQQVPRGPGNWRDDRPVVLQNAVEKGGFSGVWMAGDKDAETVVGPSRFSRAFDDI